MNLIANTNENLPRGKSQMDQSSQPDMSVNLKPGAVDDILGVSRIVTRNYNCRFGLFDRKETLEQIGNHLVLP